MSNMLRSLVIVHALLSMQDDDYNTTLLNLHTALAGSSDDTLELSLLKKSDAPRPQPGGVRMSRDALEALEKACLITLTVVCRDKQSREGREKWFHRL